MATTMAAQRRQLALVSGASSGIGLELARCCAENGFDLIIAADEPQIHEAASKLRATGAQVDAVEADLATTAGVDSFHAAANGRAVDALLANAGRGLGDAFLDQEFERIRYVIDTNVTGTLYLIQKVGREMRAQGSGRNLDERGEHVGDDVSGTFQGEGGQEAGTEDRASE